MEGILTEYTYIGSKREPSGESISGIVPSSTFRTKDNKFVFIGANGDSIFYRLCKRIG